MGIVDKKYFTKHIYSFVFLQVILLLIGVFFLVTPSKTFALEAELNSGSILSYGCATGATICNLGGRGITSITPDAFINHPLLQSIDLENNHLTTLPENVFDTLTGLAYLDCNFNNITSLPSNLFQHTTGLTYINFFHNQITTIPDHIFDNLSSVEYLFLNSNQITSLPDHIFDYLSGLKQLNLDVNQISLLPLHIFDYLSSLTDLYLNDNMIADIPSSIFDHLTHMTAIYLQNNQISILPSNIFDYMTGLHGLFLNNNLIMDIPEHILDKLTVLQALWLNDNLLTTISQHVFDHQTYHLRIVSLYNNQIHELPSRFFGDLTGLWVVFLQNNQIASLPDHLLDNLTGLTHLYLNNNELTTIPDISFMTSIVDSEGLNIHYNHINTTSLSTGLRDFIDTKHMMDEGDWRETQGFFPIVTGLTISGETTIGSTLTGAYSYEYPHHTTPEGVSHYQRYRNADSITGATGLSYITTSQDAGKTLSLKVIPYTVWGLSGGVQQSNEITLQTLPSGGGGGGSFTAKDVCPYGDTSASYYDGSCGSSTQTTTGMIVNEGTNELLQAYTWAFGLGITTQDSFTKANMTGGIIRSHLAKMISEFATKILKKVPDQTKLCRFSDTRNQSIELQGYMKLACQLGIMGINSDGTAKEDFMPNALVTRAEFGTVLSRVLRGDKYNSGTLYYTDHLAALKAAGIMTNLAHADIVNEIRGYVLLMLMRADK